MGIYTDVVLLEIQDRVSDLESIVLADKGDVNSCFLDLLKKKLSRCSKPTLP